MDILIEFSCYKQNGATSSNHVYGPQHCMTMLFCIAESGIKVIHTYNHKVGGVVGSMWFALAECSKIRLIYAEAHFNSSHGYS